MGQRLQNRVNVRFSLWLLLPCFFNGSKAWLCWRGNGRAAYGQVVYSRSPSPSVAGCCYGSWMRFVDHQQRAGAGDWLLTSPIPHLNLMLWFGFPLFYVNVYSSAEELGPGLLKGIGTSSGREKSWAGIHSGHLAKPHTLYQMKKSLLIPFWSLIQ